MDEISKHRIHAVPGLFGELSSLLLRGADAVPAQLPARPRLQDLSAVLPGRARVRDAAAKPKELSDVRLQSSRHRMAFLRVSCVPNFPERQLRPHQVNN